jgi:hypothetical protein
VRVANSAKAVALQASSAQLKAPPQKLCCEITGRLCAKPVRSPGGRLFDRVAIERWLARNGAVCPISGMPLTLDDCKPDEDVLGDIIEHNISVVTSTSSNSAALGLDDGDDDLYAGLY